MVVDIETNARTRTARTCYAYVSIIAPLGLGWLGLVNNLQRGIGNGRRYCSELNARMMIDICSSYRGEPADCG